MRAAAVLFAIALAAVPAAQRQTAKSADSQKLPPISYVCPMAGDEDVIEDKPGKCRKCGMTLVPVRLDSVWTCPVHAAVIKDKPGTCPLDGRDLEQVTMSVSWTCPSTNVNAINPGTCADGSPMVKKFTARAHGNHNPQHGGLFFMAPDNWHHLEGTYPRAGLFRMYFYDDFTKPLARNQVRKMTARIVTRSGASIPLVPAQNGRYLEAKIASAQLPLEVAAKVKFKAESPEHHFDFTFPAYSKEPVGTPVTTTARDMKPPPSAPSTQSNELSPLSASSAVSSSSGGIDPGLIPLPIPDTIPEMLAQLSQRSDQIRRFIDQGAFANVYVPAFQAKDLALALDEHKKDLTPERRRIAEPAIKRLVRSAWLLDAFGDIGNKQQISEAYAQFAAAVKDVESVFPGKP